MKQYMEIKNQNPDHILFFRLGDFYEMFFDDARVASKVLDLTLTTRGKHMGTEIPLAGFPHHQLDNYLPRIIKAGYRVAVCDQTEDPKLAKGIVKRERDTKDKRVVNVQLTSQGKKLFGRFIKKRVEEFENTLGRLSERDRKELLGALEKASRIFQKLKTL